MARTMASQCIYHLAISQSHTVKRRNEQYQTCPNHICSELVHTAKPVPGKSNWMLLRLFPENRSSVHFPPVSFYCRMCELQHSTVNVKNVNDLLI